MINISVFVTMAIMLGLTIIVVFAPEKNDKKIIHFKHDLGFMILACMSSVAMNVIASKFFEVLFLSLYYMMTTWFIFGFMIIILELTNFSKIKLFVSLGLLVIIPDTVSLILNPWTHWSFEGAYIEFSGNEYLILGQRGLMMSYHLAVCYLMVVTVALALIVRCATEASIYFYRYFLLSMSLLVSATASYYCIVYDAPITFNHVVYCIAIFMLGHILFVPIPRSLMERIKNTIAEELRGGVVVFDKDGKLIFVNTRAREIVPESDEEIFYEKYYEKVCSEKNLNEYGGENWNETFTTYGEVHHFEVSLNKLNDDKHRLIGRYLFFYDITQNYEKLETEHYKANHDPLTRLYNEHYFYERTSKLIRSNPHKSYLMVCCDIKGFKIFNDTFGIEAGNQVLIRLARLLASFSSSDSVYGRLHSDVFAICLLKERYYEGIFIDCMRQISSSSESKNYKMHIQMGVYEITNPYASIAVICDRAQMAINSIKMSYTDNIAYYNEDMHQDAIHEQWVTAQFSRALAERQFKVYLQPQVDDSKKCIGGEALVRWHHPEKGMMNPSAFIRVLERTALIYQLDLFVWEESCRILSEWFKQGITDKSISVNVSTRDFYYIDILDVLTKFTDKYHIPHEMLHIEITESALVNDVERQVEKVNEIKEAGFIVEMDDFGSGYSSLNMLKYMHIDVLKLDMGFLFGGRLEEAKKIIKGIISMAYDLGMSVITEGVETEEEFGFLKEFGCKHFQGYYFDRPMSLEDFEMKYMK